MKAQQVQSLTFISLIAVRQANAWERGLLICLLFQVRVLHMLVAVRFVTWPT